MSSCSSSSSSNPMAVAVYKYWNSSLYLLCLPFSFSFPFTALRETMRRKAPTTLLFVFLCLLLSALYSFHVSRNAVSLILHPQTLTAASAINHLIREEEEDVNHKPITHHHHTPPPPPPHDLISSSSVLLPNWEVLVLVSPGATPIESGGGDTALYCLFPNKETSPANFYGVLPFSNATAFTCILPNGNRRRRPFYQPLLLLATSSPGPLIPPPAPLLMPRWDFLVYESFSTHTDVILFVKGVNNRQGANRSPAEFSCVFGNDVNSAVKVKTRVTSSVQEVFRCRHPNLTALDSTAETSIKVSLEINSEKLVIPSVAYYAPPRRTPPPSSKQKSLLCATTMVYNVGKFLREWVTYYSKIGVHKFFLYDNGSDDNLETVIKELNEEENYNVERVFWIWPKTQEAGFSHSAVYGKDSCTWMMYVDVDEFIFSPSWLNIKNSSKAILLPSLLASGNQSSMIGQVSIKCNDFGPSGRKEHPAEGVIQGYNCRRRVEQRHKSIVLLDAVDDSLMNAIHHFGLNESKGYSWKEVASEVAVVNHYKYQAWPEFMTKFRRRVSAFVADWRTGVNPNSKDRTPGLGSQPIKPERWETMFCDVKDERLKQLTQRWFGSHA